MANVKTLQSNFSSGELSDKAQGRADIARYPNAAAIMENVISRTLGSADKRPGTEWLSRTKDAAKPARLVPYVVSQDTAYMLELGEGNSTGDSNSNSTGGYMRVFRTDGTQVMNPANAGIPYEIATPYNQARTREFDFAQGEDGTMFLFHQAVYPQRLRRFADAKWDCSAAPFTTTPFAEQGAWPAAALSVAGNTVGPDRSISATAPTFMAADVGRAILAGPGIAVITGFTDAQTVAVEIKVPFELSPNSSTIVGPWNLDASPQATLTPSAKDPVGAIITLSLSLEGWRPEDQGKFVRLNSGLVQLTSISSPTSATAKVVKTLSAVTAVPALAWTLESSVWDAVNGYPRTGALHEQRLVAAATPKKPQTIWGSRIGETLDFTLGVNDDDAYAFTIGSTIKNQVNPIAYLASAANLLILTYGGEFSMRGGVEKAITPTNIKIKPESPHGAKDVPPVQVGKETLFAQRAGRKLRSTKFEYAEDGYKSSDLTTLGEHLTESGIAGYCFQQEPDPVVWVWLNNGRLVSVTLDRDLDVIAWNRHKTDGTVEWVATVPAGDREQVWLIVRRQVNGQSVRYVERMRPDWLPIHGSEAATGDDDETPDNWGFQLDCAMSGDAAAGKAVWDGLAHLEGRAAACIADGVYMGEFTVANGGITLPRAAKRVHIGLAFYPRIKLLTPELQLGGGTSQGGAVSTYEVWVHVHRTIGLVVNGEQVIAGRTNSPAQLDRPPRMFTGKKKASMAGWSKEGLSQPEITQDAPLPFSLLSVVRKLTFND